MLSNLLSSINSNIYSYLDNLVFIDSNITRSLSYVLGTNFYSGINLICNSLIYGFLIYYSISYFLSYITFSKVESPLQFLFKLVLCALALNCSEFLCSGLISLCSNISQVILELGKDLFSVDISFSSLINNILPNEYFTGGSFSLFSFDGILNTFTTFGFLSLAISYAIRYILLKVLLLISPFSILSLASSKTQNFFKAWFKNLLALLFLQIFISMVLLVCFIINSNDILGLPSQIIHLGMIYTLFKANGFMRDLVGGFSTDVSLSMPNITSMFQGGVSK